MKVHALGYEQGDFKDKIILRCEFCGMCNGAWRVSQFLTGSCEKGISTGRGNLINMGGFKGIVNYLLYLKAFSQSLLQTVGN